jgi:spore maturation protein CgeB
MRSFEAGAIGACLAVEDTEEHREIFGSDGDCVRYFGSPEQAAEICNELRQRPKERIRLAVNVRHRIRSGGHTYGDRLETMLQFAQEARSAQLSEGPIS